MPPTPARPHSWTIPGIVSAGVQTTTRSGHSGNDVTSENASWPWTQSRWELTGYTLPLNPAWVRFRKTEYPTLSERSLAPTTAIDFGAKMRFRLRVGMKCCHKQWSWRGHQTRSDIFATQAYIVPMLRAPGSGTMLIGSGTTGDCGKWSRSRLQRKSVESRHRAVLTTSQRCPNFYVPYFRGCLRRSSLMESASDRSEANEYQ